MEALVDVKELGARLRVSRASIYRRMAEGMPFVKIGATTRFDPARVLAWLEEDAGPAVEPQAISEPGDYQCLSCGWVGHIPEPRPLSGVWCPICRSKSQIKKL